MVSVVFEQLNYANLQHQISNGEEVNESEDYLCFKTRISLMNFIANNTWYNNSLRRIKINRITQVKKMPTISIPTDNCPGVSNICN